MTTAQSSPSSFSSSPHDSSASSPSSPSHLRNRNGIAPSPSIFVTGGFREAANVSPTLSSFSSGSNALAPLAGRDGTSLGGHTHRVAIRVDHSIATCFDPADKELYDLWAPKP
ncbi:hypothetical protein BJV78DRAFT_1279803 [Lactifluus subvellereus]|nr:hypothetical protein BJV78DRAFT_1279803 [Lactifluus subvellereus]